MALIAPLGSEENQFEISELKNLSLDLNLNTSSMLIQIISFELTFITLSLPKVKCAVDHLVLLKGFFRKENQAKIEVSFVGKVTALEQWEHGEQKLTIRLSQYDKVLWEKFIFSRVKNQTRIDRILKDIKGEE